MYCKVCGKELPDGAARCGECGTPVDQPYNNFDSHNSSGNSGYSYSYDNNGQPAYEHTSDARRGFAIASLVMGIVGLVGTCCSMMTFGVLNLLLGVVGLIFGILGLKSQKKGMAIAGIVMAALNLIIGVLLLIVMVAAFSMTANMTPDQLEAIYESIEALERMY